MSTRTKPLPTIEPILVVTGSPPLHDPNWIYEPKFDGWRGTLYLDRHASYIRSKRANVLRRFWELAGRLRAELQIRDAILDGEVVALDEEGRMSFNMLQRGRGHLHYVAEGRGDLFYLKR
jgi:bifunctional non-homologous end joining protein LigD